MSRGLLLVENEPPKALASSNIYRFSKFFYWPHRR